MTTLIKEKEWKKYILAALLFTIIFVVLEVAPMIASTSKLPYDNGVIAKEEAVNRATAFAETLTGRTVERAHAFHQSDKLLNGYLAKEKLIEQYVNEYDEKLPTDTFQVNVTFGDGGTGFLYVHMYTGEVVAWNMLPDESMPSDQLQKTVIAELMLERGLRGVGVEDIWLADNGSWVADLPDYKIGEAELQVTARTATIQNKPVVTQFKPVFHAPDGYIQYVKKQDFWAGVLTGVGYLLMSIVLCILAIIYAILYRKHTSFKYGILLTVVFLIAYIIMNVNMLDGIRASSGEDYMGEGVIVFTVLLTLLMTIPMAGSVYISIVAGDGLWKAQGFHVWPRFREAGYGQYVWRSMGLAYLLALIMLGLQPIIFRALEAIIGTWGTSDVTMSPYNMKLLWLMPVLAWAAAISEEAVFRFFGIGLFRRWFRHSFAAAILPTLFWALGHVMYPFYPSTTRLIELMIIGLLFSFIFIKYGFITAMFTHAIFNSVAVGSSLFMVGNTADMISAIFFIVLPVLIAYVIKKWHEKRVGGTPAVPPGMPDPSSRL
ncbi:CPBP family glutamic-type intramembrane protease [Paenibacillus sp. J5C_2022]|uniref:CPBP family intramembrane glutamic endopeptidase n=1 Tax=Paenibacillus sp. J5C2022 TaxID=2977129 RepID=UPI0021CE460C|nr:type II CAAX endopeptidase family protein [Paenibacillus sp. J5C2022]MCU6709840.1 CPBP family glutamic-type intramembrane protease [Paenibacillus sp. J5C2022]